MTHNILEERKEIQALEKNGLFDDGVDFGDVLKEYEDAVNRYKELDDKSLTLPNYLKSNNVVDHRDECLVPAKKLYQLKEECAKRQASASPVQLLPLDATSYQEEAFSLLENLENVEVIKKVYRMNNYSLGNKKNSGLPSQEAEKVSTSTEIFRYP